eukprot:CAMPEP_0183831062 /NCGR_PEP_ID=MMETSP0807_2-20130328/4395_1 /TAXON_ID=88271 /ORGANISM="Picocystis salinarum, Strain CCMP1897" /LENGTH=736 /DNA_ID=CAMNT_0026076471 /DNA_START=281 /DNA_END=2491 /DNA_ORIENTATION=-
MKDETNPNTASIPLDPYKVLGIPRSATAAERELRCSKLVLEGLPPGFSQSAAVGRKNLIDLAKRSISNSSGDAPTSLAVPSAWLPGAVSLLQEAGEPELVEELGKEALAGRLDKAGRRDILLAMALAECDLAQDAVSRDEIALACARLNNGRDLLKQGGMPPISEVLQTEIEACLESLVAPCILEHLSVPLEAPHAQVREEAIQVLQSFFDYGPAEILGGDPNQVDTSTSIYMSSVQKRLTAEEVVDLIPWLDVAQAYQKARSLDASAKFSPANVIRKSLNPQMPAELAWFSPTTFHNAAVAHIVVGFLKRKPQLVAKAEKLLDLAELSDDAVRVERAMCRLLLGDPTQALEVLFFTPRSAKSTVLPSSFKSDPFLKGGKVKNRSGTTLSTAIRSRDEVLDFIKQNSPQQGEGEEGLLPGLCLFAEKWMKLVGFQRFRDTADSFYLSTQLAPYFESHSVQSFINRRDRNPDLLDDNFAPFQRVRVTVASMASFLSGALERNIRSMRTKPSTSAPTLQAEPLQIQNGNQEEEGLVKTESTSGRILRLPLVVRQTIALAVVVVLVSGASIASKAPQKLQGMIKKGAMQQMKADVSKTTKPVEVQEELQSPTILTLYSADKLIRDWQMAKAIGMGPWHDVSGMKLMLLDPMLTDWSRRVKHAEKLGCSWKYTLEDLTVSRVDQEPGSPLATVTASIAEVGELLDSNDALVEQYSDKYVVQYTAVRSRDAWRLSTCKIIK